MDFLTLTHAQALAFVDAGARSSPWPTLRLACLALACAVRSGNKVAASTAAFEVAKVAQGLVLSAAERDMYRAVGLHWQLFA